MAETPVSVTWIASKVKGAPTAVVRRPDGRAFWLHSRVDPIEEAKFLVKDSSREERTMHVVMGFGLGYHVKELLQRAPRSSHVVVVEPESACLSRVVLEREPPRSASWMQDHRLHRLTYHDPKLVPVHLADCLPAFKLLSVQLLIHIPSTMTAIEFYRTAATEIPRTFPAEVERQILTFDRMLENDLQNLWANLPFTWNAAPLESLRGAWANRPLIIASAGPSLTDALPLLRERRADVPLLATGPTAKLLMAQQLLPDLVVAIDPYEANLEHFTGWDTSTVPLVYYHRVYRGILPSYAGPTFAFGMHDEPAIPLSASERSRFSRGGTVAFSALQLAHYLEANPIIFVGQDFAFSGGHTHAAGTRYDDTYDERLTGKDYLHVPGVTGAPVVTTPVYYNYLLQMQDYLVKYGQLRPDVKHINASRIGARILGMEQMTLQQGLLEVPPEPLPSFRAAIRAAAEHRPPMSSGTRKATVRRWAKELDQVLARSATAANFEALFASFKKTSVYAQVAHSYDNILYIFEGRYRSRGEAIRREFTERFSGHLRSVAAELRRIER